MKNIVLGVLVAGAVVSGCAGQVHAYEHQLQRQNHETVSAYNFAETNQRLKTALEKRGLTVFAVIDHAEGAKGAGLELAPNTLYIFGNPKAGTLLMQENSALGMDLPLKALVRETSDGVVVTVSDIQTIATYGRLAKDNPIIEKIDGLLKQVVSEATA